VRPRPHSGTSKCLLLTVTRSSSHPSTMRAPLVNNPGLRAMDSFNGVVLACSTYKPREIIDGTSKTYFAGVGTAGLTPTITRDGRFTTPMTPLPVPFSLPSGIDKAWIMSLPSAALIRRCSTWSSATHPCIASVTTSIPKCIAGWATAEIKRPSSIRSEILTLRRGEQFAPRTTEETTLQPPQKVGMISGTNRSGSWPPSKSRGQTWSEPVKVTPPSAHPADLCLLPDGRVLLVT
jgi:hypothetical protein